MVITTTAGRTDSRDAITGQAAAQMTAQDLAHALLTGQEEVLRCDSR